MRTQIILAISAVLLSMTVQAKTSSNAVKTIDPELVSKNFKKGKFMAENTEVIANGPPQTDSESICMDATTAAMVPMIALMGLANCDPVSTDETKTSMTVTGICRKGGTYGSGKATLGPHFFTATVTWSPDGKTIDSVAKRSELIDDKPSDKILMSLAQKYKFQSASCK